MKRIFGILALLMTPFLLLAIGLNDLDPDLIVQSKSGLKLRLNPNLEAPVLSVIGYGENVKVLEDSIGNEFNVSWVKGKWIKVEHNFQTGYVFDGFLSELPVPSYTEELGSHYKDLGFALYNYAHLNFQNLGIDTLSENENSLTTSTVLDEHELFVHEAIGIFKVELTLNGVRLMDAYNLLENMLDSRSARSILKENSMFFRDRIGLVNKVKIGGDDLKIIKLPDGRIKISSQTIIEGC